MAVDWIREHLPPRRDALAAVVFAVVWFGGMWFGRHHGWVPLYAQQYQVAGLSTVAVLLVRASWPRITLITVAVVYPIVYSSFLVTGFHLLPLLLAAYTATARGRISTAWALVIAELGITVLNIPLSAWWDMLLDPSTIRERIWQWNLSQLSLAQAAVAAVVLLGHAALGQRRTAAQLLDRHLELERLRRLETDQVVSAERTRIARELHDVVAHHISAVVIRAQAADRVADSKPEETRAAVRWIAANGQETLAAMRHVVRVLRSTETGSSLAPQATLAELPEIAARMGAVGLPVELRLPEPTPVLPAAVELATVRIIQEALTNVLVHAGATRAVVDVRFGMSPHEDEFRVEVHDDGTAAAPPTVPVRLRNGQPRPAPSAGSVAAGSAGSGSDSSGSGGSGLAGTGLGGNGLIGMRERAVSCGGTLTIGTSPLGGWLVTAVLRTGLVALAPRPTPTSVWPSAPAPAPVPSRSAGPSPSAAPLRPVSTTPPVIPSAAPPVTPIAWPGA